MSYSIYFYKKRKIDHETFVASLESNDTFDQAAISLKDFIDVKDKIKQQLNLTVESGSRDCISFGNFEINRHAHYISMSIPYWPENAGDKQSSTFAEVQDVFIGKSYGGYDPQCEQSILIVGYSFYSSFSSSMETVLATSRGPATVKNKKLLILESAQKHYEELRKKLAQQVETLNQAVADLNLDYSPESLIRLERFFLNCYDKASFQQYGLTRQTFDLLMCIYFGEVIVRNRKYEWKVEQIMQQKTYSLAVVSSDGMNTIFIGEEKDLIEFRAKDGKRMYREFKQWTW